MVVVRSAVIMRGALDMAHMLIWLTACSYDREQAYWLVFSSVSLQSFPPRCLLWTKPNWRYPGLLNFPNLPFVGLEQDAYFEFSAKLAYTDLKLGSIFKVDYQRSAKWGAQAVMWISGKAVCDLWKQLTSSWIPRVSVRLLT